jgi:hypothetical protein
MPIPEALLDGRGIAPVILARLDGRDESALGLKPKLSRDAGPSLPAVDVLALGRFLLERTVTLAGMLSFPAARGLARGGVVVGAGNLECTLCTRCSKVAIFCRSPRSWYSDSERGGIP